MSQYFDDKGKYYDDKGMSQYYDDRAKRQYYDDRTMNQYFDDKVMSKCFPEVCERERPRDFGPCPFVTNIEKDTLENNYFRRALWTGRHLQLTLMSIRDEIGLEMHPNLDQFLRLEQGEGIVLMGRSKDCLTFRKRVRDGYAIIIPAGTWHNLINTGRVPIKLYSIYAPPQHPWGTVHRTREEAEEYHD